MNKTTKTLMLAFFLLFCGAMTTNAQWHHRGHFGFHRHSGLYTTLDIVNTFANVTRAFTPSTVVINPVVQPQTIVPVSPVPPAPVVTVPQATTCYPAPVVTPVQTVTTIPQPAPVVVTPTVVPTYYPTTVYRYPYYSTWRSSWHTPHRHYGWHHRR